MDAIDTLLAALRNDPADDTARLVLADGLEEAGLPARAELTRLLTQLRIRPESPLCPAWEGRIRQLLGEGVEPCVPTCKNSIGMEFVLLPPGIFWMGSPDEEEGRFNDEGPLHEVTLSRGFYLSRHPVTQEQYCRVLGNNPSFFSPEGPGADEIRGLDTSRFPAESISWDDTQRFCRLLGERPGEEGRFYRLPTEAEWEYACRGGIRTSSPYSFGWKLRPDQAKFDFRGDADAFDLSTLPTYLARPVRVGSYRPNGFGLHDMHGNVWEWCSDRFSEAYYRRSPAIDPSGPRRGTYRVLRGGSWFSRAVVCRSACRNPVATPSATGLRVVLVVDR